jgi:hypothetical protein
MKRNTRVGIRLQEDERIILERLAKRLDRNLSDTVRHIVRLLARELEESGILEGDNPPGRVT